MSERKLIARMSEDELSPALYYADACANLEDDLARVHLELPECSHDVYVEGGIIFFRVPVQVAHWLGIPKPRGEARDAAHRKLEYERIARDSVLMRIELPDYYLVDGHMLTVGLTVGLLEALGFPVRQIAKENVLRANSPEIPDCSR